VENSKEIPKSKNPNIFRTIRNDYINYRQWRKNWFYISKMAISSPIVISKALFRYTWMYDLMKSSSMLSLYTEGRNGPNYDVMEEHLPFTVKYMCKMYRNALKYPDNVVINQDLVPAQIMDAMGLYNIVPEIAAVVLPKVDQFCGVRYLDAAESKGLPGDTCGLPRFTTGIALMNELPQGRCIVSSNLPCDGGLASYECIQKSLGNIPIYRLSVPYDFRNDESIDTFAKDLKGMIKFLEENTEGKMDWDKLREICGYYNELIEIELERWELAKTEVVPLSNDSIWFPHYFSFNAAPTSKGLIKHQRKLLKMDQKAYKKGIPSFDGIKYRVVMWNPPPSAYGHIWNWLERCWGIATVMDLETYGSMKYIDTATPDSMVRGLARAYMWASMAKHTRGPAENMIGDMLRVIEEYKPDFVLYPAHMGCKNSMSLEAIMKEECRKRKIPFCVFRYDLCDNRVTSRQQMRDQISKFMIDVMKAEPLDSSLLRFDDGSEGKW
jgi:benzoyl-CoA reductase/2-hydroxyglutaryl-CoA dehydratase subunit BcrC/BadD/HgdB